MTKKLILVVIATLLMVIFCSCGRNGKETSTRATPFLGFVVLDEGKLDMEYQTYEYILVDPETRVLYAYMISPSGNATLSVLYNTDGSVKLYTPHEE